MMIRYSKCMNRHLITHHSGDWFFEKCIHIAQMNKLMFILLIVAVYNRYLNAIAILNGNHYRQVKHKNHGAWIIRNEILTDKCCPCMLV